MIDETEARVRAAVLGDTPDLNFSALQTRVKQRRTRRQSIQVGIVIALVIAVSGLVVAVRHSDNSADDASHVAVPTNLPPITWTRTTGIPGAVISQIVSGPLGTIAVGNTNATIWYSSDNGTTWNVVYSEPPTAFTPPPTPANPQLPQPTQTASSNFAHAYATTQGFVVIGSHPTNTPNSTAVWTSPDGRTWQRIDSPAFLPTTKVAPKSVTSAIYGLTEHRGQLVAVGDIFTNNPHQQAGLNPCIWTSHDGTHWTRKIAHLGNGYDPYFTAITVHAGTYVASGRTGKYPATAWISRDLKDWTPYTITPQGTAEIVHTAQGYIAYGSTSAGKDNNLDLYKPAIWQSNDGHTWHQVLGGSNRTADLAKGDTSTGFGNVVPVNRRLVAIGQRQDGTVVTPLLYQSVNGRTWTRMDPEHSLFSTLTSITGNGTINGRLVLAGSVPVSVTSTPRSNVFWTTDR